MTAKTSHICDPGFYASYLFFLILCIRHNVIYNLTYEQYNEFFVLLQSFKYKLRSVSVKHYCSLFVIV